MFCTYYFENNVISIAKISGLPVCSNPQFQFRTLPAGATLVQHYDAVVVEQWSTLNSERSLVKKFS